ncbi:hypothetical protein HG531_002513 [Fusarium graminearum]|nr:hypothetical protein HG531_002513 [Fusarium graminearum]
MRDRQARGKNPYVEESDASDAEPMRLGGYHIAESHMERERRGEAMFVLDNPEALMAHAQASGDSIAGQRLRFMRQLCGFDNDKYDDASTSSSSTRNTKRRPTTVPAAGEATANTAKAAATHRQEEECGKDNSHGECDVLVGSEPILDLFPCRSTFAVSALTLASTAATGCTVEEVLVSLHTETIARSLTRQEAASVPSSLSLFVGVVAFSIALELARLRITAGVVAAAFLATTIAVLAFFDDTVATLLARNGLDVSVFSQAFTVDVSPKA